MKNWIYLTAALGLSLTCEALTLEEILAQASENSPHLVSARFARQAADADVRTASRWENPELEFEAEGVGGDNDGLDAAEYTLMISQELPVSGKLGKERLAATYGTKAAHEAEALTGLEFEAAVRSAFVGLLAAQERLAVQTQQVELAQEFLDEAARRREAGAVSELDVLQAELALEDARLAMQTAEKNQAVQRRKLELLTGIETIDFADGDFYAPLKMPIAIALNEQHPMLRQFESLEKQADAETSLARRSAIPDVSLGAGARYEEDGNVHSYLFSASIPLPLFNRGSSATLAAGLRAEALRAEHQIARRELLIELEEAVAEFETAAEEAAQIRTVLLPRAERAAELVSAGYASGRFGWLEQLEARQTLADNRLRLIDVQQSARLARIRLIPFMKTGAE